MEVERDVQRLHIRSTIEDVDHDAATQWCLEHGQSGMGWGIWEHHGKLDWDGYAELFGEVNSSIRRFRELEPGTLVWTREIKGEYWIGEITGKWRYSDSATARRLDLFNLRKTRWTHVGTEDRVPGRVVNAFRSPRTLQRIADHGARSYTQRIFLQQTRPDLQLDPISPEVVLESLIGADDLEDLVSVYLQVKFGYVVVSRFRSTPGYEYVLKDSKGKTAVASVKSGDTPVDLSLLPDDAADIAYVFSVAGKQVGKTSMDVRKIEPRDLALFLESRHPALPDRVTAWL